MIKDIPAIIETVIVNCTLQAAWDAWTTESGILKFFAPACKLELRSGGPYEMYFMLDAPTGSKGGEGNKILALEPMKMLSFTWNAPPQYPQIRGQRTTVILNFREMFPNSIQVTLNHVGWGEGEQWEKVLEYFQKAWRDIVLPRFKKSLEG